MSNLENHFCGAGVSNTEGVGEVVRSWNILKDDLVAFHRYEPPTTQYGSKVTVRDKAGGIFIGIAPDGTGYTPFCRSNDLVTWTTTKMPYTTAADISAAVWPDGHVLAFCANGPQAYSSTDFGVTWSGDKGPGASYSWGLRAKTSTGIAIFTAWQDAVNWAITRDYGTTVTFEPKMGTGAAVNVFSCGDTLIAIPNTSTTYYTSTDGTNWITRTASFNLVSSSTYDSSASSGNLLVYSDGYAYACMTIDNGITFTQVPSSMGNMALQIGDSLYFTMYYAGGAYLPAGANNISGALGSSGFSTISFIQANLATGVRPYFTLTTDKDYVICSAKGYQWIIKWSKVINIFANKFILIG